jgi:hypothetical protein
MVPASSPGRDVHDSAAQELAGVGGASVVTAAEGVAGGERRRSATGGGTHVHGVPIREDIRVPAPQLLQVPHHVRHRGPRLGHITATAQRQRHELLQRLRWVVRYVRINHRHALPCLRPLMRLIQPTNQHQ